MIAKIHGTSSYLSPVSAMMPTERAWNSLPGGH
jgi:hypothetical protein